MRIPVHRRTLIGWLIVASALLASNIGGCSLSRGQGASEKADAESTQPPRDVADIARSTQSGKAELTLLEASIDNDEDGWALLRCKVRLDNRTEQTLGVRTCCSSAFDGLDAVATARDGSESARQSHRAHQSPYAEDVVHPLAPGPTTTTLTFPLHGCFTQDAVAHIWLEGQFPGTNLGLVESNKVVPTLKNGQRCSPEEE